ncbi:MAG: hypothetical protein ISR61_01015 [Desulfobacteraceae bacterium]|uniref:Nucleotidyltransferase family protein n=1 Tax=Candidatus Desulfacyla euxinica TaxID=2841693 RepID=A0A8J6T7C9_9DELT|nr:hypothetical protein [Candidatus Desulfacyla euxinica]MBL6977496.1 hypothetical protein [Desulfobacteraceae bacterium]MBL7216242.1 hypothetical protein [Desulfobacteraceae bacterium]
MKFKNVILLLIDFFESHQVDYALTGAFALKAYGYLRATRDVDFVGRQEDQFKIIQFLESLGFETRYRSTGYSNHCHGFPGLGQIDFVYVSGKTATTIFSEAHRISILKDVRLPVVTPMHLVAMKVFAMKNDPRRRLREMADIEYLMTLPQVRTEDVKAYFEREGLLKDFQEIIRGKETYEND